MIEGRGSGALGVGVGVGRVEEGEAAVAAAVGARRDCRAPLHVHVDRRAVQQHPQLVHQELGRRAASLLGIILGKDVDLLLHCAQCVVRRLARLARGRGGRQRLRVGTHLEAGRGEAGARALLEEREREDWCRLRVPSRHLKLCLHRPPPLAHHRAVHPVVGAGSLLGVALRAEHHTLRLRAAALRPRLVDLALLLAHRSIPTLPRACRLLAGLLLSAPQILEHFGGDVLEALEGDAVGREFRDPRHFGQPLGNLFQRAQRRFHLSGERDARPHCREDVREGRRDLHLRGLLRLRIARRPRREHQAP
mmetsp:Transcript_51036/g.120882  ORF Transcript_51036/g.120882 Transcript_51036/m.120882 type:complete len:307 (+) Transcript_51036:227-1147(+)